MKITHITKSIGSIPSSTDVSNDLALINKFSRRTLNADEVFIFSVILCDNNIDRDFEQFSLDSLHELKSLFLGTTGVFDHVPTGSNQNSRIFFTDVITDNSTKNSLGEPYSYLLAKAYMVRSDKNKDLILDIDAGIKKEVSIGCSIGKKICSICGSNRSSSPCNHIPGKYYQFNGSKSMCFLSLQNPLDAYEWSFVAVPAQVNAGVIKGFSDYSMPSNPFDIMRSLSIDNIKKSLASSSESLSLSKSAAQSLLSYIGDLEEMASLSKSFHDELKSDVSKLLTISQPSLNSTSVKNIVDKLSPTELKSLKIDLQSHIDSTSPNIQLPPSDPPSLSPNSSPYDINSFKIS